MVVFLEVKSHPAPTPQELLILFLANYISVSVQEIDSTPFLATGNIQDREF